MKIVHDGFASFSAASDVATGGCVTFRAEQVRDERTGMHGKLTVLFDDVMLTYSTFNVDRDEDRVRLANSAYKHLENDTQIKKTYPKEYLKADLDRFCHGLREAVLDTVAVEALAGDETRALPSWCVYPYLLEGGGTILYGPPGRGKSFMLLLLAVSLETGISKVFEVPKARRVLVVNLERSAISMTKRLGDVNEALGLPRSSRLLFLNARGSSLTDVAERIRRAVREHEVKVIFLDSLSRSGVGDLNENAVGNRVADTLNGLAPTWLALGHTPRGDDTHLFGTQMFDAAADVLVQLVSQVSREKWEVGVGLEVTKSNDFLGPEMQVLALQFHDQGLGLVSVRHASKHEFGTLNARQERSMPDAVSAYVEANGESSASTISEATGFNRSNVSHFLANDRQFASRKNGKETLYHIAPAPALNGRVGQQDGQQDGNRIGAGDALERVALARAETTSLGQGNTLPETAENTARSNVLPSFAYGEGNTISLDDDEDDEAPF